jgi:hypothetical protein
MRKDMLKILLVTVLSVGLATPAWSYFVGTTDVGAVDTWKAASPSIGSSDAAELAYIRLTAGDNTLLLGGKLENSGMVWQPVNYEPYIWAIYFGSSEPSYFLLKTGNLNPGGTTPLQYTIVFQNVASMEWGVIDLRSLPAPGSEYEIAEIGKISHVTYVPEPGTMLLLCFGLIGLAAGSRKFRK